MAVAQARLPEYLDLCADIGFTRIECGCGFTDMPLGAREAVRMAAERGLDVQFELGKKHTGAFTTDVVTELLGQGHEWLDAGALDWWWRLAKARRASGSSMMPGTLTARSRIGSLGNSACRY